MTAMMARSELRQQVTLAEKDLAQLRDLPADLRPAEPYELPAPEPLIEGLLSRHGWVRLIFRLSCKPTPLMIAPRSCPICPRRSSRAAIPMSSAAH
jgi:hypothetical protein